MHHNCIFKTEWNRLCWLLRTNPESMKQAVPLFTKTPMQDTFPKQQFLLVPSINNTLRQRGWKYRTLLSALNLKGAPHPTFSFSLPNFQSVQIKDGKMSHSGLGFDSGLLGWHLPSWPPDVLICWHCPGTRNVLKIHPPSWKWKQLNPWSKLMKLSDFHRLHMGFEMWPLFTAEMKNNGTFFKRK